VSKLSDVIKKIEKLLRVAAGSNHPGEVEAAQRLAQELITKYQIDEAQLGNHSSGGVTFLQVSTPDPYSSDKAMLLNYIAKHNFCKVLRSNEFCMIYGYQSDITICVTLYEILNLHMISEMLEKLAKVKTNLDKNEKVHSKTWIKSFFGGYCIGIGERLSEAKTKVINDYNDKAIDIIVRDKQHAVEEYYQELSRKPARKRTLTSASGYQAGIDSANNADLNQTRLEE
jgi:hypothetical protein